MQIGADIQKFRAVQAARPSHPLCSTLPGPSRRVRKISGLTVSGGLRPFFLTLLLLQFAAQIVLFTLAISCFRLLLV